MLRKIADSPHVLNFLKFTESVYGRFKIWFRSLTSIQAGVFYLGLLVIASLLVVHRPTGGYERDYIYRYASIKKVVGPSGSEYSRETYVIYDYEDKEMLREGYTPSYMWKDKVLNTRRFAPSWKKPEKWAIDLSAWNSVNAISVTWLPDVSNLWAFLKLLIATFLTCSFMIWLTGLRADRKSR